MEHGDLTRARFERAAALHRDGAHEAAAALCLEILREAPDHAEALHLSGLLAYQAGQFALAVDLLGKALRCCPERPRFLVNLGCALVGMKAYAPALAHFEQALRLQPDLVDAHDNRSGVLQTLNRLTEARAGFCQTLRLDPRRPGTWNNLALVEAALGQAPAALWAHEQGLALQPEQTLGWFNRGNVLMTLHRYEEALASYECALARGLPHAFVWGCVALARAHVCDWSKRAEDVARLREAVLAGQRLAPFSLMPFLDEPALLRRAAEIHAQAWLAGGCAGGARGEGDDGGDGDGEGECEGNGAGGSSGAAATSALTALLHPADKIRVAYLSADFRDHPVAHLMAGVFEQHDRVSFEWTALSFGPPEPESGAMRQRLVAAFDHFVDVSRHTDQEVAQFCRAQGIDVLVDLMGYTQQSRPGILAARGAPLQVGYLGYPGTLGAAYLDYLVADPTVIAADEVAHYTEKVIWLPDSYMPNDRLRPIDPECPTRAACGLPEQGFVFCCFNQNYKITPQTFAGWMRILARVPGSVLWLADGGEAAQRHLRAAAVAAGVVGEEGASRLVFAPRRPSLGQHLARHRLADLFLDTRPFNAHTTASDALWAGLPVLTLSGNGFPSRVAASLLKAAGLPELVCQTPQEYEDKAVMLAEDPPRLDALRARLQAQRLHCPLFDTARTTRHLERAFEQIVTRQRAGLPCEHLSLGAG